MPEISEKEQREIEESAKEILDKFANALEGISIEEARVERENDRREEEKEAVVPDKDFRKIMLENAPRKKNDCIEAEKGGWI